MKYKKLKETRKMECADRVKKYNKKPGKMWECPIRMPQSVVREKSREERIPEEVLYNSIMLTIKNCPWVKQGGVVYIGKRKYTERALKMMKTRIEKSKTNVA